MVGVFHVQQFNFAQRNPLNVGENLNYITNTDTIT
jgi:hypothetical protein